MKIIWSDFAFESLRNGFQYYKEVAGKYIAEKLKAKIFNSTKQLIAFIIQIPDRLKNHLNNLEKDTDIWSVKIIKLFKRKLRKEYL